MNKTINHLDVFTTYRPIITKTEYTWNIHQDSPHSGGESKTQIEKDWNHTKYEVTGYKGLKLQISNIKIQGKSSNIWKLNKIYLNNQWGKEINTKLKTTLNIHKINSESSSQKEIYSIKFSLENKSSQINYLSFHPKKPLKE